MSLKDEVKYVKEELSSDEKLLESAFRLERLYKKYKVAIWGVLILLVVGFGGKTIYGVYQEHRLEAANQALLTLEQNPKDTKALQELQEDNPRLYALYSYARDVQGADVAGLKKIDTSHDALLADLVKYHEAVLDNRAGDSKYYHDLSQVEKAYVALKAGKKAEARSLLTLIPENSPVAGVARLLRHYTLN
ncbi:hypothetical protein [Nitratifractor sp.]